MMRTGVSSVVLTLAAFGLAGCGDISFVQTDSPANPYKDYRAANQNNSAVIGIGDPLASRQMAANATFSLQGEYTLDQIIQKMAGTYNVAIRWGNGIRKSTRKAVTINKLTFDEARSYVEDVYGIQIIKEGDRRLLVLPSASEPRLKSFNPGKEMTLGQAVKGLAEQCGYNLVITENRGEMASTINTNLKNVTCYDAFEALLNPHGLSLVNTGDYYAIGGLPQREWTVDLYEPTRSESSEVSYASTTGGSGGSSSSSSGSSSGGGSEGAQSAGSQNKVSIKYDRDLWKELQGDLQALIDSSCPDESSANAEGGSAESGPLPKAQLLSPPESSPGSGDKKVLSPGQASTSSSSASSASASSTDSNGPVSTRCGYVRINRAVGMIQMRAPASVLQQADELIQRVQEVASRRILLEARVLAVTRTRGFDRQGTVTATENADYGGVAFSGSLTSALASALTGTDAGNFGIKTRGLDAAVKLLEQYGTTYELMHPMMELMDRQRSTLIDGKNEKYFIIKTDTTTSTSTSTSKSLEERNQFLGLQFSATAQISANASDPHTVTVQLPITTKADKVTIPDPNNPTQSSGEAPIVSTRLIDQKVRIRDGEIKVIGGLTKTLATDKESGVPLLRDIPAAGIVAGAEGLSYEKVEFVVLLQVRRLQ